MLEDLKQRVFTANKNLIEKGLVLLTWGNASAIDRESGHVVIKPSGVSYDVMKPDDMVVVDMTGATIEGTLRPSVDMATHLVLYRFFEEVGGVVHTHSHYATSFAQAGHSIPCFGTTHADYFYGDVPVCDPLTEEEVETDYETHIGEVIIKRFQGINPMHFPGVLAARHAPFTWAETIEQAVENAYVLEEIARMAFHTLQLAPTQRSIESYLLDKHFLRKHGSNAYYGQK